MRIILPESAAFLPSGASSSGQIVASSQITGTASGNFTNGPTTVFNIQTTGLYCLFVFAETYNSVAVASGTLSITIGFTIGSGSFPWTANLGLTGNAQANEAFVVGAVAGSNVTVYYDVTAFAGTSCDYAIRYALVRLA